jgi:hypothetical protein
MQGLRDTPQISTMGRHVCEQVYRWSKSSFPTVNVFAFRGNNPIEMSKAASAEDKFHLS